MKYKKIAIIGVGAIGKAFAKGLINSGVESTNIILSNKTQTNRHAVSRADWIVIAVKPNDVGDVIKDMQDLLSNKLLISLAAGISIFQLQQYSKNSEMPVIRLMPNIPISVNQGVIGFFANNLVNANERKKVISLLSPLGLVVEVHEEKILDVITLIAGCGPAIVAHITELFTRYAIQQGLQEKEARRIATHTIRGTAVHLDQSQLLTNKLIQSVSTKGGITETILKSFKEDGLDKSFEKSLHRGHGKIKALSKSLL